MLFAFQATISGRVQMVMYRDFATRKASKFGVVGEAENMPDGTVRIYAEGEKEKLDQFIVHLRKGSLLARVDDVSVQWVEPLGTFKSFSIKHT